VRLLTYFNCKAVAHGERAQTHQQILTPELRFETLESLDILTRETHAYGIPPSTSCANTKRVVVISEIIS